MSVHVGVDGDVWLLKVLVGGCLDMDLCTKQFHKQALAAAR